MVRAAAAATRRMEGLMGKWNGELDSFYTDLLKRVMNYKENEPPEEWDGIRIKIN